MDDTKTALINHLNKDCFEDTKSVHDWTITVAVEHHCTLTVAVSLINPLLLPFRLYAKLKKQTLLLAGSLGD